MAEEIVIDTMVLQKANAQLRAAPKAKRRFAKRLKLLQSIQSREFLVLISDKLLAEYNRQIKSPRNDFIKAFLELLDNPTRVIRNWQKRWSPAQREKARKCKYPAEDDHVLRTAIRPNGSTIISEEKGMLIADQCIYRHFAVHIQDL